MQVRQNLQEFKNTLMVNLDGSPVVDQFYALYKKEILIPQESDGWILASDLVKVKELLSSSGYEDINLNFFDMINHGEKIKFNSKLFQVCVLKWRKDKKIIGAPLTEIKLDDEHTFFILNNNFCDSWIENKEEFFPFYSLKKSDHLWDLLNNAINQELKDLLQNYITSQANALIKRINACNFFRKSEINMEAQRVNEDCFFRTLEMQVENKKTPENEKLISLVNDYPSIVVSSAASSQCKTLKCPILYLAARWESRDNFNLLVERLDKNAVSFEIIKSIGKSDNVLTYLAKKIADNDLLSLMKKCHIENIECVLNHIDSDYDNGIFYYLVENKYSLSLNWIIQAVSSECVSKASQVISKKSGKSILHYVLNDYYSAEFSLKLLMSLNNESLEILITHAKAQLVYSSSSVMELLYFIEENYLAEIPQSFIRKIEKLLEPKKEKSNDFMGQNFLDKLSQTKEDKQPVFSITLKNGDSIQIQNVTQKDLEKIWQHGIMLLDYYRLKHQYPFHDVTQFADTLLMLDKLSTGCDYPPLVNLLPEETKKVLNQFIEVVKYFDESSFAVFFKENQGNEKFIMVNNEKDNIQDAVKRRTELIENKNIVLPIVIFDKINKSVWLYRNIEEDKKEFFKNYENLKNKIINLLEKAPQELKLSNESFFHYGLIFLMKKMGLKSNYGGVCSGFAMMGIPALLLGEHEKFNRRISDIYYLAEHLDVDVLRFFRYFSSCMFSKQEQSNFVKLQEIEIFLQTLDLLQQPESYADFISKHTSLYYELSNFLPVALNSDGINIFHTELFLLHHTSQFLCCNTKKDIEKILDLFNKKFSECEYPVVFSFVIPEFHAVTVGLSKKEWLFVNSNLQSIKLFKDIEQIASAIFKAFDIRTAYAGKGIDIVIYVSGQHEKDFKDNYFADFSEEKTIINILNTKNYDNIEKLARYYKNIVCDLDSDLIKIMKFIQDAADKKHPGAQYFLAYILNMDDNDWNIVIKRDVLKAFEYCQALIDQNNSYTISLLSKILYHLGVAYFDVCSGVTEKNEYKSIEYFAKSAEKGDSIAQYNMSRFYSHKLSNRTLKKDLLKALEYCERSAAQSYQLAINQLPELLHSLGIAYFTASDGITEKNEEKALYYFRKSAEAGNPVDQYKMALAYSHQICSDYIQKDFLKALDCCKKSAAQNNSDAISYLPSLLYDIGQAYASGCDGVTEKDSTQAVEFYRKSVALGYKQAFYKLALHYQEGIGVDKNFLLAFQYCQKAAEKNVAEAITNLSTLQKNLGIAYEHARWGIKEKNYMKAVEYYKTAASENVCAAQYRLAICYQYGRGVEQNFSLALEFCQKAANQNYPGAKNLLSIILKLYPIEKRWISEFEFLLSNGVSYEGCSIKILNDIKRDTNYKRISYLCTRQEKNGETYFTALAWALEDEKLVSILQKCDLEKLNIGFKLTPSDGFNILTMMLMGNKKKSFEWVLDSISRCHINSVARKLYSHPFPLAHFLSADFSDELILKFFHKLNAINFLHSIKYLKKYANSLYEKLLDIFEKNLKCKEGGVIKNPSLRTLIITMITDLRRKREGEKLQEDIKKSFPYKSDQVFFKKSPFMCELKPSVISLYC